MSVEAITWALLQKTGDPSSKLVLVCLANYAGHDGSCFPSHRLLAEQTEQCRSTVKTKIKELEGLGFLKRRRTLRQNGAYSSNMYYLPVAEVSPEFDRLVVFEEGEVPHGPN